MEQAKLSQERCETIGAHLCAVADRLVAEWEEVSRAQRPCAGQMQRDALRNALPDFLREYGSALQTGAGSAAWRHASEHGELRLRQDWSVEDLARDFLLLRRLVIAEMRRSITLSIDEGEALSADIDEAVALSVAAYVEQRDREHEADLERVRRSHEDLKKFAHVVAHEVRNPLGIVHGSVHRMERDVGEKSGLREPLARILQSVEMIKSVTDDLVRYADADGASQEPADVDLTACAKAAAASLRELIDGSEARVRIEPLPTVRGHEQALVQLFTNLIENALKYRSERTPEIRIFPLGPGAGGTGEGAADRDASRAEEGREKGEAGGIVVEDNGLGIPEGQERAIFRFFRRAHEERGVSGSGIGLAVCKRIAEQHGGKIWVESSEGEGSRFYVRLAGIAAEATAL